MEPINIWSLYRIRLLPDFIKCRIIRRNSYCWTSQASLWLLEYLLYNIDKNFNNRYTNANNKIDDEQNELKRKLALTYKKKSQSHCEAYFTYRNFIFINFHRLFCLPFLWGGLVSFILCWNSLLPFLLIFRREICHFKSQINVVKLICDHFVKCPNPF